MEFGGTHSNRHTVGRRASAFWKTILNEAVARRIVPLSLVPDSLRESRFDTGIGTAPQPERGVNTDCEPKGKVEARRRVRSDSQSTQDTFWTVASAFAGADKVVGLTDRSSWVSRESAVNFEDDLASEDNRDFTAVLPTEIVDKIFAYVPYRSLVRCQMVSRNWAAAACSNSIWRQKYAEEWGLPGTITRLPSGKPRNWRRLYEIRNSLDRNLRSADYTTTYLEGHTDSVYCAEFDTKEIITGSRDNTLKVWDLKTKKQLHSFDGYDGSVLCVAMDDKILVSGSSDKRCQVYDRRGYHRIASLEFHDAPVLDVALTDGFIITAGKDGRVAVWGRKNHRLQYYFDAHRGPVNAIAICGATFLTAGADGHIKQWHTASGEHIQTLRGHTRGLACVEVSSCGNFVVSGSNDRTLRIWNLETGSSLCLEGHLNVVRSVCISGPRVFSASYDSVIKVWDLKTGRYLSEFPGHHGNSVFCVRANARYVVATSVGVRPIVMDFGASLMGSAVPKS